jgi:hypothetical protein
MNPGHPKIIPPWLMGHVWMRLPESHAVVVVASEDLLFDDREASLSGIGVEIGAGSMLQIAVPFALDVGFGYRSLSVKTIDGEPPDDSFGAGACFVRGGPALLFKQLTTPCKY